MIDLRYPKEEDLPILREMRNLYRQSFFYTGIIDENMQAEWYRSLYQKVGQQEYFAIVNENSECIGSIAYSLEPQSNVLEVGKIMIAAEYRKLGVLKEAFLKLIKPFTVQKTILHVKIDNISAIKSYLDIGFQFAERSQDQYTMEYKK